MGRSSNRVSANKDTVVTVVRDCGACVDAPPALIAAVLDHMLSSIRLVPSATRSPIGGCRLGGLPDLPVGVNWPRFTHPRSRHTIPYRFLMQIDLVAVTGFDLEGLLPEQGRLWFFLHWDDDGHDETGLMGDVSTVLFDPVQSTDLVRASAPSDLPRTSIHKPLKLTPRQEWTVPAPADVGWENAAVEPYLNLWDDLEERVAAIQGYPARSSIHRLLGHPQLIQAPGVDGPVLLAQVDSDPFLPGSEELPKAGMMWGDAGRVYYFLDPNHLRKRRFAKAWSIVEMC